MLVLFQWFLTSENDYKRKKKNYLPYMDLDTSSCCQRKMGSQLSINTKYKSWLINKNSTKP